MDDNLTVVLTAVPLADHSEAQQWFQALRDAYVEDQPDTWDAFVAALAVRAPATAGDFGDHVANAVPDPLDRVRELLDYGDTLPDWYFAITQQAATFDESEWQSFLSENGPLWLGTEETWQPWRDWFAHAAAERGLSEPATGFLTWLDTQPDKVAAFASYGITITPPDDQAAALDEVAKYLAELDQQLARIEAGDA